MGPLFLAVMAGLFAAQPKGAGRDVTISISVKTTTGSPVAHFGLQTRDQPRSTCASTDADGKATVHLRVDGDGPRTFQFAPTVCQADDENCVRTLREAKTNFAFKDFYPVTVPKDAAAASLDVVFQEAVVVRGETTCSDGISPDALFQRFGWTGQNITREGSGKIGLHGVAKGEASEVFVRGDGFMEVRPLSAAQTAADVDLGKIAAPNPAGNTEVSLHIDRTLDWPSGPGMEIRGVLLVRADQKVICFGPLNMSGYMGLGILRRSSEKPKLAQGEYFVGLGYSGHSWIDVVLWNTLKQPDGKAVLRNAGWPMITIPAEGAVSADVVPADVAAAAKKVQGY